MNQYSSDYNHTSNYQELKNTVSSDNDDVSKHIKSLQARLGFARFKMKQGWETSTLLDVEQLWKQKQQKLINELPKPRFTQRDIIDKRAYIPSPGARHARAKKAKLTRTYSNPSSCQSIDKLDLIKNTKPALYFHHYNHQRQMQLRQEDSQIMDSSSASSSDGEHNNDAKYSKCIDPPPPIRNSLDYLSYAIAMTEGENLEQESMISSSQPLPDISGIEPNYMEEEKKKEDIKVKPIQERTKLSARSITAEDDQQKILSPPSSPVTSAAKAIMMFVNSSQPHIQQNNSYSR